MSADRLPLPPEAQLTAAQRTAAARIASGPRGALFGPFVPLLRSPELMTRLQLVGEYLRFDSVLDDDLIELVILVVARHWDQDFEYGFHQPLALKAGLPPSVVEAVARGGRPAGRPEVAAVWDLLDELHRSRQVGDDTYAKAVDLLGEARVVEVVGTAGYYTTLAMTMNVARTPPPAGAPRLPAREGA
ncbi:carboxymuconolactone decarboxylase family protein [Actinoplanes sp. TRM 88003]|uniref:Carboxymuconolactone decarboxylase family protein n=1 Tax=Paractinoplanes aksuensis TaxID=2939490 RepID=A0ABT1E0N2_9ACTN|nr:carboxymuconolactone decarboxylase family protein [Actinoplanes aksuensis]MCO8276693.1 carboxymuconolactone decarboxylase family protein [Actinoplanes aksuensis]